MRSNAVLLGTVLSVLVTAAALLGGDGGRERPLPVPKFEKITLEPLQPPELRDDSRWQLAPGLSDAERKKRIAAIDAAWAKPGYRNEGSCVFDVNRDGKLDICAGASWYQGPDFRQRHPVRDMPQQGEFCPNFGEFPYDLNQDGWTDIITGSWMSRDIVWYENPGPADGWAVRWKKHRIDTSPAFLEGLVLVDIDGDGGVDILPNTHENGKAPVYFIRVLPGRKPTFQVKRVGPTGGGHGVGAGDLNGDGHIDIICTAGWYQAPKDAMAGKWLWHAETNPLDASRPWLGMAGLPVQAFDVNGDGLLDVVYGQGHDYGTAWYEQRRDDQGRITWRHHFIDRDWSQAHTWTPVRNLLGCGEVGFVTGKRIRGHASRDPGSLDRRCLYYYVHNPRRDGFDRLVIREGDTISTGMNINVVDIDGDGDLDIVVAGKSGLYLLRNRTPGVAAE